ncbi:MAG: DUF2341 domain-containing protein, partial [Desulfobacterales bacterium]|nr:DUF2341 domain-containing protein [Desulfobacterales bacterium]
MTHDAGAWESRAFNRNQNGRDFESQVDVLAGASALNLSAEQTAANLVQTPSAYDPASEMMNQTPGRELVLINSNLAGTDQLITDLSASDRLNTVEVVLLDAERGGIAQVNAILSARANLAAVHVLTHGSEGQIQLGNEWLNSATLQENRHSVAGWGDALTETGDFLFYGCDIAADSLGESLLNTIADLTGADVAASNDATGHASKGGDWTLEYTTGVIEKKGAVQSGTLDDWSHLLAPPVASDDSYSVDEDNTLVVDWWHTDWSRRQALTFDNSGQPDTLTDFPVLVQLNSGNMDYAQTQGDGADLRFIAADGTQLAHEIVKWDESGDSYVWVKVPQITGGSNADSIMMYYGNTAASDAQDSAGVWSSDFAAVYHLENDLNDATANANHGANSGSTNAGGQVGDGQLFDGIDDYGNLGSASSVDDIFDGGATISAWINPTRWGEGGFGRILDKADNIGTNRNGWAFEIYGGNGSLLFQHGFTGAIGNWISPANSINLGQWQHVAVVFDSGSDANDPKLYINGVEQVVTEIDTPSGTYRSDADIDLTLGNYSQDTNRTFDGILDDVRVSRTQRSADWIAAEHLSMTGAFVSLGGEEPAPATGGLLSNDSDADGDPLSVTLVSGPNHAQSFTLNKDGTFNYTPTANYYGSDTFTYEVSDGNGGTTQATVNLTVNSITDAPIATDDPGIFSADLLALNPLSYWRLGETAGAAADLGSSANNGTYNGGALGQPGAINGDGDTTVRFDALNTDYVAIAHSDDYLLDNGTVQLWFNADTAATGDLQHLFSKDSLGEDTGGHLSIYLNAAGRLEVRLQSDSSSYYVTSPSAVTAGQWHHVAFTFGAGGMALYLDGQSVDTNGYSGGLGTTSGDIGNHEPIAIGGGTQISDDLLLTPANQFFTGQIDEVAIVGSPLGAQAVRELFGAGRQDYTVDEENTLNVAAVEGVLINDFDVEGDPLTVTAINGSAANIGTPVTLASGARVTLNADGSFLYDPNGQFDDLSQGQTATDSFSYVANDGSTDSNPAAVSITITGVNDPPVDLQATATTAGGISLNADGGNDVYLVADNGGGLLGGLTTLTVEASFAVNTPAADNTVLLSYADGTNDEELALFLKNDGSIWFCAHSQGASHQSTANQYPQLFDGEKHHVGASWDASSGSVVFYVDGQQVESFGGYQTGRTITGGGELVFGQDQDSELGGFNTIDLFSGVLHDVRIFNDVRTAGEIAANFDQTLPSNEPGMIANWTFNDLSTGGIVVDAVSSNNLTVQHVGTGGGFTPSTPELTLEVEENSPNGTVVGTITASDPDAGDTLTYSLLDDAGGRFEILPASGVIRVADGSLLNYDSSTSHNVTVRVSDALSNTYDEVFTIQVTDLNEPPVAVADSFTVAEGTTTNLNLAANDSDPENALDLASIAIVSGPTYGSVAVNGDGTVDYTHDGTANFLDAFSYTIADNAGTPSNTVAVDLTITPQNDSPLARPDGVYLAFDGDDFIRVADDASLQMTNNVTMEAWINHNGGGTGSQLILNKEGEYEMGITADTGEIKYAIADTTDNWTWHNTGYFVTTGAWTHVAVTFDGVAGEIRTYIDGQLVDTLAQPGPMGDVYTMHNDLTIGGRGNATNQRFQGQIDEVRVWNTTRTQGEIQANMNNLLTGGEAGLAGYWRLDEAGTASVVDHSANSNAGILGGADATPTYQGYVTDEDTLLTIPALSGVLANDADEESDPLSVVAINGSGPSVGTPVVLVSGARVTLNADGSFIYDPNGQFEFLAQGETTTDTFTYVANDGSSDSNPATVTIAITGINDAPTTTGLANQNLGEDFADYTIDLKTIFADAETSDANLIYTVAGNSNIGVSIDANGIATISATTANWNGTETITFSARDESGASVDATADFIVAAVNDAPTVSAVNLGSIA